MFDGLNGVGHEVGFGRELVFERGVFAPVFEHGEEG